MLAKHSDCIVQAPTGSGKTLAYLLPTIQHLINQQNKSDTPAQEGKCSIVALVIVPSRELVEQVGALFKPICAELGWLKLLQLVGGVKRVKVEKMFSSGKAVLVATPGRLQSLVDRMPRVKAGK